MLVELLRPAGPELARRWLAALLVAPSEERESLVEAVEAQIASTYATDSAPSLRSRSEPVQREGHTEETIVDYDAAPSEEPAPRAARSSA